MPTNAEILAGITTQCCIPEGLIQRARLWVATQNLSPVPSVDEIMSGIASQCCIPDGLVQRGILWADSEGGGGGGGAQQVYIGRDPAAPDDPTLPAISFPSGGGTITQWDVASQTWV